MLVICQLPFKFELERVIDDFVFMCLFVGNDFLPNTPHLDIADGSLNHMMNIYKVWLPILQCEGFRRRCVYTQSVWETPVLPSPVSLLA